MTEIQVQLRFLRGFCPVCCQRFGTDRGVLPKLLDCFHLLCEQCVAKRMLVDQNLGSAVVQCHKCFTTTVLPDSRAESLQTDKIALTVIEKHTEPVDCTQPRYYTSCSVCNDSRNFQISCDFCGALHCVSCHEKHANLASGHAEAPLCYREALRPPSHCRYHPEVFLLYRCMMCKRKQCHECNKYSKAHTLSSKPDKFGKTKEELYHCVQKISAHICRLQSTSQPSYNAGPSGSTISHASGHKITGGNLLTQEAQQSDYKKNVAVPQQSHQAGFHRNEIIPTRLQANFGQSELVAKPSLQAYSNEFFRSGNRALADAIHGLSVGGSTAYGGSAEVSHKPYQAASCRRAISNTSCKAGPSLTKISQGAYQRGASETVTSQEPYQAGSSGTVAFQNPYQAGSSGSVAFQNPYQAGSHGAVAFQNPYQAGSSGTVAFQNPYQADSSGTVAFQNPYQVGSHGTVAFQNPYQASPGGTVAFQNPYQADSSGTVAFQNPYQADSSGTVAFQNPYQVGSHGTVAFQNPYQASPGGTVAFQNPYQADSSGTVAFQNPYQAGSHGTVAFQNPYQASPGGTVAFQNPYQADSSGTVVFQNPYQAGSHGTVAFQNPYQADSSGTVAFQNPYQAGPHGMVAFQTPYQASPGGTVAFQNPYQADSSGTVAFQNPYQADTHGTVAFQNPYQASPGGTVAFQNPYQADSSGMVAFQNPYQADSSGTVAFQNPYQVGPHGTVAFQNPYQAGSSGTVAFQNPYQAGPHGTVAYQNPYHAGSSGTVAFQNPYQADSSGTVAFQNPYQAGPRGTVAFQNPYQAGPHGTVAFQNPYQAGSSGTVAFQNPYQAGSSGTVAFQNPYQAGSSGTVAFQNPYQADGSGTMISHNPFEAGFSESMMTGCVMKKDTGFFRAITKQQKSSGNENIPANVTNQDNTSAVPKPELQSIQQSISRNQSRNYETTLPKTTFAPISYNPKGVITSSLNHLGQPIKIIAALEGLKEFTLQLLEEQLHCPKELNIFPAKILSRYEKLSSVLPNEEVSVSTSSAEASQAHPVDEKECLPGEHSPGITSSLKDEQSHSRQSTATDQIGIGQGSLDHNADKTRRSEARKLVRFVTFSADPTFQPCVKINGGDYIPKLTTLERETACHEQMHFIESKEVSGSLPQNSSISHERSVLVARYLCKIQTDQPHGTPRDIRMTSSGKVFALFENLFNTYDKYQFSLFNDACVLSPTLAENPYIARGPVLLADHNGSMNVLHENNLRSNTICCDEEFGNDVSPVLFSKSSTQYCAVLHCGHTCVGKYSVLTQEEQTKTEKPFIFTGLARIVMNALAVRSFDYSQTWNMAAFVSQKEYQVRLYHLPNGNQVSSDGSEPHKVLTVPDLMYPAKQFNSCICPCDVAFCVVGAGTFLAVCFQDSNIIDLVDPRPPGHVYIRLDQQLLCRPVRMDMLTYKGVHYLIVGGLGGHIFVVTLEQRWVECAAPLVRVDT